MKSDGMHATVAMMETIRTMLDMSPKKGLMSCASCSISSVLDQLLELELDTHRTTERICQACQRCAAHSTSFSEPHITIACRRR
jgi:hypothetical protein